MKNITQHNSTSQKRNSFLNTQKLIGSVAAIGSLALMAAGAQAQTFASVAGIGTGTVPASQVFTYTGGAGGTFSTTAGALFSSIFSATGDQTKPSVLTFTGLMASAPATGTGIVSDPYTQGLGGGSFTLTGGGNTLLTGNFTSGNILTAATSSDTAAITNVVKNVTYTGGTYFTASGLVNPGSFSIAMTSVTPGPTLTTGGYLSGFTAGGSVNYSASQPRTTVPEPATLVPFALGGLGLLGLIVRKTRRANGAAA